MRKYYVILMIPLALATRGHAVDANQPAGASASKAAQDNAALIAEQLASIYGRGNLYIELQRHQQRDEEARNQALLLLASALLTSNVA